MKMHLYVFVVILILIGCRNSTQDDDELNKYLVKVEEDILPINNTNNLSIESFKLISIGSEDNIICANHINKNVIKYNIQKKTFHKIKNVSISENDYDVSVDAEGNLYVLHRNKNLINVFDMNGDLIKKKKLKFGDRIVISEDQSIYVYKTFFYPNLMNWKKNNIMHLTAEGKYLNSWLSLDNNPNIDYFPISGGTISIVGKTIVVSHWSDPIVKIYSLEGKLLKTFDYKPTFYYKMSTFNGLTDSEVKKWHNTTLQVSSFLGYQEFIISFYSTSLSTKSWLVLQRVNFSPIEINIPEGLHFLGASNNKIYFMKTIDGEDNKDENKIKLLTYEFKKELFK